MLLRRYLVVVLLAGPIAAWAVDRPISSASFARMQADIKFLASDECEGRGPGTNGIGLAADHIAAAFKEAGLKPAGVDGTYFQPFKVRGTARVGKSTALALNGPEATVRPKLNTGFQPIGYAAAGKAAGDLVFVGYGITAPEQNYDDYAGLDVAGKVVVILRRSPRYHDTKTPFADDDTVRKHASIVNKLQNAEKHNAAGIILVNDVATAEASDDISDFARLMNTPTIKIPAVHVRRTLVAPIIKTEYGQTLGELEEQIDKDLKPLSKPLKGATADLEVVIDKPDSIETKNVLGMLEGAGPLADQTIIIGAHYDHLGYGGSGSLAGKSNVIHHGADDNASGTTTILELARRFGAMKDRQGRRLVFMTFSGEEMGLLGSAHYCKEPVFPLDKTAAMINLDMVGRLVPDKESGLDRLEVGGTGTAKEFEPLLDRLNEKYKFKIKKTATGLGPSDHQSFYLKNRPVLFLFTGLHPDYHRPSDTWDKINVDGMVRIADMVEDLTKALMTQEGLEFVKVAGPAFSPGRQSAGPRIRIGIMMDYSDEGEGVLLQGVTPGGPAEKAGLKEADRIIAIAGHPIRNVTGYMSAMEKAEKGKPLEFTVKRGKEEVKINVTPQ